MNEQNKKSDIELHVAGATVRTKTPFQDLVTFKTEFVMNGQFINKWVLNFYSVSVLNEKFYNSFNNIKRELNSDVVQKLLGDFNWRTRMPGAIFAAIKDYTQYIDIIGTHLLKSEVCFAGKAYGISLASFNTDKSVEYMKTYLEYYLTRQDLIYDQADIMSSLVYLYKINDTNEHSDLLPKWNEYIKVLNRPVDLHELSDRVKSSVEMINKLKM